MVQVRGIMDFMRREDLLAFLGRDWQSIALMKETTWAESGSRMRLIEALRIGDALRRDVVRRRPDWPSQSEREEDLAVHARVSEALSRVQPAR